MIHHFDKRVTADAKRYHTWLYVKCTKIYDHICTQIWRSVSVSGHGNPILKQLTRPTHSATESRFWCNWALKFFEIFLQNSYWISILTLQSIWNCIYFTKKTSKSIDLQPSKTAKLWNFAKNTKISLVRLWKMSLKIDFGGRTRSWNHFHQILHKILV